MRTTGKRRLDWGWQGSISALGHSSPHLTPTFTLQTPYKLTQSLTTALTDPPQLHWALFSLSLDSALATPRLRLVALRIPQFCL